MKLIHITDIHLLKNGEFFHGFDTQKRFDLCVQNIIENHSDAHCIIVTGDLTERGEPEAYQYFNEQMATTGLPVYSTLGNHDERESYIAQFSPEALDSDGFVQTAIETPVGVLLLLDTKLDGSDAGIYCLRRQQWLLAQLKRYSTAPVYLFMHHPPFDLNLPGIDKIGLNEKEAFASVVKTHADVRHIFFGHAHRPVSGNWKGISISSMSGTNHQSKLNFAGVDNPGVCDSPEYAIVFIDDDQIIVHMHRFMDDYL